MGSQDGLVCITEKPYRFQDVHLNVDYHFLFLLLLNQRFSAILSLGAMSRPDQSQKRIMEVHQRVVELKTRYSFRVASDDFFMQSVYSEMYRVFDLDNLMKDLEEGNDRINTVLQEKQETRTRFFGGLLAAISILSIFSALVDLAQYMEQYKAPYYPNSLYINLGVIGGIVLVVAVWIFVFRRKR